MKKVKTKMKTVVIYDDTPGGTNQLRQMIHDIESGKKIDAPMQSEILSELKNAEANRLNQKKQRAGKPIALSTFQVASITRELVSIHNVRPVKSAIIAAMETVKAHSNSNEISYDAAARTYRKIKNSPDGSMMTPKGDKIVAVITAGVIDEALARLPESARGTPTNRVAKPPFNIQIWTLSKHTKSGNK